MTDVICQRCLIRVVVPLMGTANADTMSQGVRTVRLDEQLDRTRG